MKKSSNSLIEALRALINVINSLFKKMPVLFLVLIYLLDIIVRIYQSKGGSTLYLVGLLILISSISIYISSKSIAETTLSFILGILTVYSINWEKANFTLFILLYFAYIVIVFYISVIRFASEQESILIQAASKLDIKNHKEVYKRLKIISQLNTPHGQLSIIDKCEVIRYLAFRQVMIGEYEEALKKVELLKSVCQIDLISCCEIYYGFFTYCRNKKQIPPNISKEVEIMFDKVTTLTIPYMDFFNIFSNTKRILVEDKLQYMDYIFHINNLALQGYSDSDIIILLKNKFL
jgi:hypothetical protein